MPCRISSRFRRRDATPHYITLPDTPLSTLTRRLRRCRRAAICRRQPDTPFFACRCHATPPPTICVAISASFAIFAISLSSLFFHASRYCLRFHFIAPDMNSRRHAIAIHADAIDAATPSPPRCCPSARTPVYQPFSLLTPLFAILITHAAADAYCRRHFLFAAPPAFAIYILPPLFAYSARC